MKNDLNLTISEPCSEDWNKFAPAAGGKFCGSCSKVVIDFTKATEEEIIDFFANKPKHACGRFRSDQLKSYSHIPVSRLKPGFTLVKAGFLSLVLLVVSRQASAQTSWPKAEIEMADNATPIVSLRSAQSDRIIRGVVRSQEDTGLLPGVNVVLKGTTQGTVTDVNGRFELSVGTSEHDTLVFTFIGLKTKEVVVPVGTNPEVVVSMEFDSSQSGEFVIMMGAVANKEVYVAEPTLFQRVWQKVRGIF